MKYIYLPLVGSLLSSCMTTTVTETRPDGSSTKTETTVADPVLIGKAIDAGVTGIQIAAQNKQAEVDQNSGK